MVNLGEDWKVLEEYARDKHGYYQVLANDGTVERAMVGFDEGLPNPFQVIGI